MFPFALAYSLMALLFYTLYCPPPLGRTVGDCAVLQRRFGAQVSLRNRPHTGTRLTGGSGGAPRCGRRRLGGGDSVTAPSGCRTGGGGASGGRHQGGVVSGRHYRVTRLAILKPHETSSGTCMLNLAAELLTSIVSPASWVLRTNRLSPLRPTSRQGPSILV